MSWRKRAERFRTTAGSRSANQANQANQANPANVVILAIESEGKRSSIIKASKMLDDIKQDVAPYAIRIVVVQTARSRIASHRTSQAPATARERDPVRGDDGHPDAAQASIVAVAPAARRTRHPRCRGTAGAPLRVTVASV